jgi:PAS domain S-box-containing protein
VLFSIFGEPRQIIHLEMLKGAGYILVTAALLYLLIQSSLTSIKASKTALAKANEELELQNNALLAANKSLKTAQKALAESEARYRTVGELIPFGTWVWDPHEGLIYLSDSFLSMAGVTLEECRKLGWTNLLPAQDVERTLEDWKHCLERSCFWDYEMSVRGKDGRYHTILSRGIPLRDKDGKVLSWVGIHLDIDQRKQIENDLNESRRALETLLSNLPGMAYRCKNDKKWTMEFVSDGCMELTGYSPSDFTRDGVIAYSDIIHTDDLENTWDEVQVALNSAESFRLTYRIRSADGKEKWVWEQGQGVFSPAGQLIAIEGFISDITERREALLALQESEERYRVLVESSSDAILMVDANRRMISFNNAFLNLFGYERAEVEGRSIRMLHQSDESFEVLRETALPIIERAGAYRMEWMFMRKDGTVFPIEETISAITGADGKLIGYVAVIRDITERKMVEEELREYRDQLEELVTKRTRELELAQNALIQKEKLKTLGAIAAEVAHEIRNPLMVIGGFARRLRKTMPDLLEAQIILNESERLEKILDRIKDYLKPVEIRPQECSVNTILSRSLNVLSKELEERGLRWEIEMEPNIHSAFVDPEILGQVFANLIRNAAGNTEIGAALKISTWEGDGQLHVGLSHPAKSGDLELLLMPFDVDNQALGVPLSYRLLKDIGGLLTLSKDGDLMMYTVSLPYASTGDVFVPKSSNPAGTLE